MRTMNKGINIMRNITMTLVLAALLVFTGCDLFSYNEVQDPNNPTVEAVTSGATAGQLVNLATGLESRHRTYANAGSNYQALVGVFGREMYAIFNSDPNFWRRWVQTTTPNAENDPTFFAGIFRTYTAPYNAIAQANLILTAVDNTDAISDTEKNGYRGYANTIKGFQYLIPLQTQYRDQGDRSPSGSIRIDVDDFLNPGPFRSYDDALSDIRDILDQGYAQLQNSGTSLHFADGLSSGFDGFATAAGMAELNRAIAARAALYAEDWQGVLDALDDSFIDFTATPASMNIGGYHVFQGPPDTFNPMFWTPNQASTQILMVHPDILADTTAGDGRISKFFERNDPVVFTGESTYQFMHQVQLFNSNDSPIPFIRNEELLLMYAEASARESNFLDALDGINAVRNAWGLGDYAGPVTEADLIDEIVYQRKYSLYGEGHRWIDMRRLDRLNQIDTSLDGGRVPLYISRPLDEINWENRN